MVNALTGTSMTRLRKKELWLEYSRALADSLSLTKAAERCGVNRTTAFRWRHRFLPLSGLQGVKCSGITEMDETYFRESFKGKKVLHRKPRKRGKLDVRGLSSKQIPVVVVRDRSGHTCDAVALQAAVQGRTGVSLGMEACKAYKQSSSGKSVCFRNAAIKASSVLVNTVEDCTSRKPP
jgi:hypothetical protein